MRHRYLGLTASCLAFACLSGAQAPAPAPLHVVELGSGFPVVVALHGGPGIRHDYLRPEWDSVTAFGRVVYYDQRGCGLSTPEGPHSWMQHVRDLHELLARLSPDTPVVLAGSSWGSLLALLYAHAYPARTAALILSGLPTWPEASQLAAAFGRLPPEDRALYETLASTSATSPLTLDSARVAASPGFHPSLAPRVGVSCTGTGRATSFSLRNAPPLAELRRVNVPTLIVHGPLSAPSVDGAEEIGAVLPRAEVVSLDGTGHNPWVERPDAFFSAVRAFLNRTLR